MLNLLISIKKARRIANLARFYYLELIVDDLYDLNDLDANHVDHVDYNQEGSQDWKPCKVS